MSKGKRAQYTLEFKIEAVRLVRSGQSVAAVSATLGVSDQTLHNWVRADSRGLLKGTAARPVSPEQMEISRLRAELSRVKMERDILKKATVGSTGQGNILSTLALGVGNGANGTTWTITTPEERIVAPMEGWSVAH